MLLQNTEWQKKGKRQEDNWKLCEVATEVADGYRVLPLLLPEAAHLTTTVPCKLLKEQSCKDQGLFSSGGKKSEEGEVGKKTEVYEIRHCLDWEAERTPKKS